MLTSTSSMLIRKKWQIAAHNATALADRLARDAAAAQDAAVAHVAHLVAQAQAEAAAAAVVAADAVVTQVTTPPATTVGCNSKFR